MVTTPIFPVHLINEQQAEKMANALTKKFGHEFSLCSEDGGKHINIYTYDTLHQKTINEIFTFIGGYKMPINNSSVFDDDEYEIYVVSNTTTSLKMMVKEHYKLSDKFNSNVIATYIIAYENKTISNHLLFSCPTFPFFKKGTIIYFPVLSNTVLEELNKQEWIKEYDFYKLITESE